MRSRRDQHPDLNECALEDRILLAAPSQTPSQFLAMNSGQLVAPGGSGAGGSSGGSSGNSVYPGPLFYNYNPVNNLNAFAVLGAVTGGAVTNGSGSSVFSIGLSNSVNGTASQLSSSAARTMSSGGGGGGDSGGGGNGTGGRAANPNSGFGGSFSSGFSFALNSANNFGMGTAALGSVPVHTFGGGGDFVDSPYGQPDPDAAVPEETEQSPINLDEGAPKLGPAGMRMRRPTGSTGGGMNPSGGRAPVSNPMGAPASGEGGSSGM